MEDFWNDIVVHGNVPDSDDNEDASLSLEYNGDSDRKESCGDKSEENISFLRVDGPLNASSNRSVREYTTFTFLKKKKKLYKRDFEEVNAINFCRSDKSHVNPKFI